MVEQRLDIVGLFDLAEPHPAGNCPHEHARPDHAGVHVEPLQVTEFDPGVLGVAGRPRHDERQPGQAGQADRKTMWAKMIHATSISGGPERGHFPVKHGGRPEPVVKDASRCASRPTPGPDRRRRRPRASSTPASPAGTLHQRSRCTAKSYQDFSQFRLRRNAFGSDPSERKPKVFSGSGSRRSVAITATVLSWRRLSPWRAHRRTSCRRTCTA